MNSGTLSRELWVSRQSSALSHGLIHADHLPPGRRNDVCDSVDFEFPNRFYATVAPQIV